MMKGRPPLIWKVRPLSGDVFVLAPGVPRCRRSSWGHGLTFPWVWVAQVFVFVAGSFSSLERVRIHS
jgi:hypothetical protein